jgi:predicted enzyme related to lactoylglutathione lyase
LNNSGKEEKMNRVVHFDISADDPERAVKFYTDVFGWTVQKWDGPVDYWLVSTGLEGEPGIDGGIVKRKMPSETTTNTIEVPSVDEYLKKIGDAGGKIIALKMPIPGVGYLAMCLDTEGNPFGIMEADPDAK